jgi:hypothetical protein
MESVTAANFRKSVGALYAADAGLELVMGELRAVPDWNLVLDGTAKSALADGEPDGTRALADGSTLDLGEIVNRANCGRTTPCSAAEMDTITAERPWGGNNPRWRLYAHGRLAGVAPAPDDSPYYVAVLAADDPAENDDKPWQDGASPSNPGSGVLALRAEAFGPFGTHKVVELTIARERTGEPERGYSGQRGQDERNNGAGPAPVQSPGGRLTTQMLTMSTGGVS